MSQETKERMCYQGLVLLGGTVVLNFLVVGFVDFSCFGLKFHVL